MAAGKGGSKLFRAALDAAGKNGTALIRTVKKWAGKNVDDAASSTTKKLSKKESIALARKEARDYHDELAGKGSKAERKQALRDRDDLPKTPSKNGPSAVTAATDPDTGITKAGTTFKDNRNPPYGGCAEDDALDRINKARGDMVPPLPPKQRHEVYYSEAYRMDDNTRPGDYVEEPICKRNCQDVSDPKQYPDGVGSQHQRQLPNGSPDPNDKPARWDQPGRTDIPGGVG